MIELTNKFHGTRATVRAVQVGQTVSLATYKRVRRALCGQKGCSCSTAGSAGDGRYSLVLGRKGHGPERGLVVDNRPEATA
jgi:hypothetical protein